MGVLRNILIVLVGVPDDNEDDVVVLELVTTVVVVVVVPVWGRHWEYLVTVRRDKERSKA